MDIIRDLFVKADRSIFIQIVAAFMCPKEFDRLCSGVGINGALWWE